MTSGYMKCPKCRTQFQEARYQGEVWTELPEPWECPKCKILIVVDREKGYGLREVL